VPLVARPEVIKVMREQASPESLATFWNPRFPGQISSHLAIAEELAGNAINLEGHDLVSVPLDSPTLLARPAFTFRPSV